MKDDDDARMAKSNSNFFAYLYDAISKGNVNFSMQISHIFRQLVQLEEALDLHGNGVV